MSTEELKIALAGNPNSGKTSLFNALTGLRQKVGNYPGVTVDRKSALLTTAGGTKVRLVDVPGIYSLYATSEDEKIATAVLTHPAHEDRPQRVIIVADGTQLRRSLLLCTQVMDLGYPVVLALNMADLLEQSAVTVNTVALSKALGVPVVSISALNQQGLQELMRAATAPELRPAPLPFFHVPDAVVQRYAIDPQAALTRYHQFHLAVEQKGEAEMRSTELAVRYDRIQEVIAACVTEVPLARKSFTRRLDAWLLHPVMGYVVFLGVLALVFQALFAWAQYPMDGIEWLFATAGDKMKEALPDHFFTTLLVDGLWTGLSSIVVFVPQIAMLFLFFSILEDSGYMSRAVFLMDRIMRPFGFSGRAVIPLIGGMACAVPSIMMARTIRSPRERLLTIMVIPLMSCSARIPVYVLLISLFIPATQVGGIFNLQGLVMTGMYLLGFVMALLAAVVIGRFLKSDALTAPFITELPLYRSPRWMNALLVMWQKSRTFVTEAGKVILLISLLLTVLISFGPAGDREAIEKKYAPALAAATPKSAEHDSLLTLQQSELLRASWAGHIGQAMEPVIRPMGFDWKIGISLLSSFAAREVFVGTMNIIYSVHETENEEQDRMNLRAKMLAERDPRTGALVYSPAVAAALLVFYAFAMQCMSTLAVTRRETGSWKLTGLMLVYLTGLAYVSAVAVYQVMHAMGW